MGCRVWCVRHGVSCVVCAAWDVGVVGYETFNRIAHTYTLCPMPVSLRAGAAAAAAAAAAAVQLTA